MGGLAKAGCAAPMQSGWVQLSAFVGEGFAETGVAAEELDLQSVVAGKNPVICNAVRGGRRIGNPRASAVPRCGSLGYRATISRDVSRWLLAIASTMYAPAGKPSVGRRMVPIGETTPWAEYATLPLASYTLSRTLLPEATPLKLMVALLEAGLG